MIVQRPQDTATTLPLTAKEIRQQMLLRATYLCELAFWDAARCDCTSSTGDSNVITVKSEQPVFDISWSSDECEGD